MTSYAFADLITFTRSTTATYVNASGNIASAAIDAPRFTYDPVTLAAKGFMTEEQRTNLMIYSEQFASWPGGVFAATISSNAGTAPDNQTTADKLIPNTTLNSHGAYHGTTHGAGTFTFSVFAKAAGYPRLGMRVYDGVSYVMQVTFDISAGTVVSAPQGTASIQSFGNGWYRCIITATTANNLGAVTGLCVESLPAGFTVQQAFTGDGTSGALVWGAQLEAGSFATSYIPTVASQVTRSADDAVIQSPNFSSWYNSVEGTLSIEGSVLATATGNRVAANLHNSASAGIMIGNSAGGTATDADFYVTNSGDQAWLRFTSAVSAGTVFKISGAYKANDFAASANGAAAKTDTTGTVPTATLLRIGRNTGSAYFNGHIRSIKYYPARLTNAQLQSLTV